MLSSYFKKVENPKEKSFIFPPPAALKAWLYFFITVTPVIIFIGDARTFGGMSAPPKWLAGLYILFWACWAYDVFLLWLARRNEERKEKEIMDADPVVVATAAIWQVVAIGGCAAAWLVIIRS